MTVPILKGWVCGAPAINGEHKTKRSDLRDTQTALPDTTAPQPSLKTLPGNSDKFRKIVIQVQTALIEFGYFPGPITGKVDAPTRAGLTRMQDAYGLKGTGTITPQVLSALGIAAN